MFVEKVLKHTNKKPTFSCAKLKTFTYFENSQQIVTCFAKFIDKK